MMTINVDQNDEPAKQQLSQDTAGQTKVSGESRRRFTTSGLAVSGVILTLASRPVLGATLCKSPSGFESGNTSTHGDLPVCLGQSASIWLESGDPLLAQTFSSVFGLSNPSYDNRLLSFMLQPIRWKETVVTSVVKQQHGIAGQSDVGSKNKLSKSTTTSSTTIEVSEPTEEVQLLLQRLVAAFLNARRGKTPFLTEDTIKSIFNEWKSTGSFSPTAGVPPWDTSQIIDYLSLTQDTFPQKY